MPKIIRHGFYVAFMAPFMAASLHAQTVDEGAIKQLVQQEMERLLSAEGVLDAVIEKGIERFIIKRQQAAAQREQAEQHAKSVNFRAVDAARDHIFGNPEAAITLVEYSDFACPFCKKFHPTATQLVENNRDQVRWVYRHFPLSFHPGADKEAEAAECVAALADNDAFWKYADLIYQRADRNGQFPLEELRPLAEEIGVDGDAFDACMRSGRMTARVKQDHDDGKAIGVSGTPASIFINGDGEMRFIAGAVSLEELQALVDDLLK